MKVYSYRAMDNSGNEEHGFLTADSKEEVMAELRGRGLFGTSVVLFAPQLTPEWSAISLISPSSIPTGRLLSKGLPCTHEHRRMSVEGTLNLLGVNGDLQLVFDTMDGLRTDLELPIQKINQVQRQGMFRKRVVITTSTEGTHVFRGAVSEIQCLCEWGIFAAGKAARGG